MLVGIFTMCIFLVVFLLSLYYFSSVLKLINIVFRDIISQLFLRNCGLCVLSRFGITDDIHEPTAKGADSNLEFIEAVHMAGATTVMYPLWAGNAQGALGTLGTLLFFIR